jgi:UDP-glucuronate decarboxylase
VAERALVTGGAGFIGLHLCRRLLAAGYDVVVLDNLSRHGMDPEFERLRRDVRFVDHDLSLGVPAGVPGDCALVLHLAAWVGVGRVSAQPYRVLRENIGAVLSIVDWCTRNDVGTLFLSSTSEVVDGAGALRVTGFPVPEGAPFVLPRPHTPRSCYALSKLVAESLLMFCAGGPRVRIGRYFNVYGPRMGTAHVIPQFIERVLAGLDPFPIHGGSNTRAFCYVSDAVEATVRLVSLPTEEPVLVNIGDDREELAMTALAERLFTVAGYAAELDVRDAPPGSPRRRLPDLTHLRERTGYRPAVTLDEGLAATYEWYARRAGTVSRR